MSHHIQRDASGRLVSLLHETNEMPQHETRQSYSVAYPVYSNYAQADQKRDASFPNTPDLSRSHSYDSQASGHDSPLTPNSAYHEPLFSNLKDTSQQQQPYGIEIHTVLPPISSFHKVAGTMEARTPTTPELSRRRSSNPYTAMFGAASSSSSLEDFHYRHSVDAHRPVPAPSEPAVHHSVESTDDSPYSEPPLIDPLLAVASESRLEKPDASIKKPVKIKVIGSQKRYPCKDPSCDKSFTTSGHASRHAKIHEGLKPISCTFAGCPKRFTRQDNMKQHLETHRREKTRASARQAGRPSLASRRQSASSRGSASRFSSPRDSPPLLSPAIQSAPILSPSLSEVLPRPSITSRTPSGLDALAMVAATESATVEHEEAAQRQAEHSYYWRSSQY